MKVAPEVFFFLVYKGLWKAEKLNNISCNNNYNCQYFIISFRAELGKLYIIPLLQTKFKIIAGYKKVDRLWVAYFLANILSAPNRAEQFLVEEESRYNVLLF